MKKQQARNHSFYQSFTVYSYSEPRVNILYHRNMPPTVKHVFGNFQMDIYCDLCMNHILLYNQLTLGTIFEAIQIRRHPSFPLHKAVSSTKHNVSHEIGHEIKYWCWCKC